MQLDNQLSLISAQVSQCPFLELGLILRSRSKQLWGKIRLMSLEIAALLCLECCLPNSHSRKNMGKFDGSPVLPVMASQITKVQFIKLT